MQIAISDQIIEVSRAQYNYIMNELAGTCFGREENGKYFIKISAPRYISMVEKIISKNTNP